MGVGSGDGVYGGWVGVLGLLGKTGVTSPSRHVTGECRVKVTSCPKMV